MSHDVSDLAFVLVVGIAQGADHSELIRLRSIPIELEFSFDRFYRNFDPDDVLQKPLHEGFSRRNFPVLIVLRNKPLDYGLNVGRILHHAGASPHVNGSISPGRYGLLVVVPGR